MLERYITYTFDWEQKSLWSAHCATCGTEFYLGAFDDPYAELLCRECRQQLEEDDLRFP